MHFMGVHGIEYYQFDNLCPWDSCMKYFKLFKELLVYALDIFKCTKANSNEVKYLSLTYL